MEEWQKDLTIGKEKDNSLKPEKIIFYVFRHGHSVYKEELGKGSHQETGEWDQDLVDLTIRGISDITKAAEFVGESIDPDTNIITIFSSPRARTIASAEIIEKSLKNHGIEIMTNNDGSNIHIAQILRSGGDYSPLYDVKTNGDKPNYEDSKGISEAAYLNRINRSTGLRFKEFLNFMIQTYSSQFPSTKTPVFVVVTHNEVLSAFLEKLNVIADYEDYKEEEGIIPFGSFFKIEFNSKKPNSLEVLFPNPVWHFDNQSVSFENKI